MIAAPLRPAHWEVDEDSASGVVNGQPPVWAGDRMIVWAERLLRASISRPLLARPYDPRLRRWVPIAAPPVRPRSSRLLLATWTGNELSWWSAESPLCRGPDDCGGLPWANAAYSPSTDSWRRFRLARTRYLRDRCRLGWCSDRRDDERTHGVVARTVRHGMAPARRSAVPLGSYLPVRFDDDLVWIGQPDRGIEPGPRGSLARDAIGRWRDRLGRAAPVFDGRTIGPFAAERIGRFAVVLGGPAPSAVLDVGSGSWHGCRRLPPRRDTGFGRLVDGDRTPRFATERASHRRYLPPRGLILSEMFDCGSDG